MTPDTITALDETILAAAPGDFPWDDWRSKAIEGGVSAEMSDLGRSVIREAYQHDWCEELKHECGLSHEGVAEGMILLAKEEPELTADRWQWLLATDGLRFDPWDREELNPYDLAWNDFYRRWADEHHIEALPSSLAFKRETVRFILETFDLDHLSMIDVLESATCSKGETTTFFCKFTVIAFEDGSDRIKHSGIIQIEARGPEVLDAALFLRAEEGICPDCDGAGWSGAATPTPCPVCGGSGRTTAFLPRRNTLKS